MKYKSTIILVTITVLIALYLIFGHNGVLKYKELVDIRISYEVKMKEMDERLQILESELEATKRDKAYLESVIRRELGLLKNDEDLYIIMDNSSK